MRGTYGLFVGVSALAFVGASVLMAVNPATGTAVASPGSASVAGPASLTEAEAAPAAVLTPPIAARKDHTVTTKFGVSRIDPYYWLNQKEDPEVLAYLNAENAYAEAQLAPLKTLQAEVYEELKARFSAEDIEVPYAMDGYYYQTRYDAGADYPVIVRRKGSATAAEEIVLDVPELAKAHEQYNLNDWSVSPDGMKIAFAVDFSGNRIHEIFVRDLTTGAVTSTGVKDGDGGIVWTADGKAFLYGRVDETVRTNQVKRHIMGADPATDTVMLQEDDTTFSLGVVETRDKSAAIITVYHPERTELYATSLTSPDPKPVLLVPRSKNVRALADHFDGKFYILTNENAPDQKVITISDADMSAAPVEIVPEMKGHFIDSFTILNGSIIVQDSHDAIQTLRIVNLASGAQTPLSLGELGVTALERNEDPSLSTVRVTFSGPTSPETLYEVDLATGARKELKKDPAWSWFKPELYQADRIMASAADGTQVPVTVVYRRDLKKPGGNPTLVYGYGAYGITSEPGFYQSWITMMDRGFVFAVAHVRGGREMGDAWYEKGHLQYKMNSFTDFISATEGLVAQGYAQPGKIYARGGSAGGLLMGAVVNLKGELYDGVIAEVPFVDVLTTMLDDTIPLTTFEYEEWGNPNIPEQYDWMKAYSPYDNVSAKAYPPLYVSTGLNDSQVGYFEPAKWVAKLRVTKTDANPLLFLTNMGAGHSGDSGRMGFLDDRAKMMAWLLDRAAK